MILEIAIITIDPARAAEFEAAYGAARQVIMQSPGCGPVALQRSLETPGRYLLHVEWTSVAHHLEGFRNSPLFTEWRRLIGPFFVEPPRVEHHELVG
jgi:quinol monooxygenase YgiN